MFRPKSAPSLKTRMALQAQQRQLLLLANNNNNKETVTYENEFGNSFTKISTKDASNFSTSRLI